MSVDEIRFKIYTYIKNVSYSKGKTVGLKHIKWDDFGFKTLFIMYLINDGSYVEIGDLKILSKNTKNTIELLPKNFSMLDESFISIGQSLEFYRKLKEEAGDEYYSRILKALNDVTVMNGGFDEISEIEGFNESLLRHSEAFTIFTDLSNNNKADNLYTNTFSYTCWIEGATKEHSVVFNFSRDEFELNRMHAIIGKNGTGKTQYLAKMSRDIAGIGKDLKSGNFEPRRPDFNKVIVISYSIFDEFEHPRGKASISYVYCGLRKEKSFLDFSDIETDFQKVVKKITDDQRKSNFDEVMKIFLPEGVNYLADFHKLSSGQKLLSIVFANIILEIENKSIIFFDEPEAHLHPSAISSLVRALSYIVLSYKSYMILSTHSSKIIQEIPAQYVKVFERLMNTPVIRNLPIESFGESLDLIDEDIFGNSPEEVNYKTKIQEIIEQQSDIDKILEYFDNKLSISALSYAESLVEEL